MLRPIGPAFAVFTTCFLVVSCEVGPSVDAGEMPVAFLQDRAEEVLDDVERARAALSEDPEVAAARLDDARLRLRRLNEYYLPLLAAREQAAKALRALDADDTAAGAAIDSASSILSRIVRTHGRHLQGEMREPLERLQGARMAVGDNPERARQVLQRLHHQLDLLFFRGELILEGSELDRR